VYDIVNLVVYLEVIIVSLANAIEARRTETPTGVMTTLASPTQGGSRRLSLWRVDMQAGRSGPLHRFDSEQLWTVLSGRISISCDATATDIGPGDTAVVPADVERQVTALENASMIVCGFGDAIASVPGQEVSRGTPAWIA
jgi:quercetin dioxygenase-like cupin family protein